MQKTLILITVSLLTGIFLQAQPTSGGSKGGSNSYSFIEYQKSLPRPGEALQRKEDTLQKQFEAKKLTWPARYMYIRSFKYDSQLEVWVKNELQE